MTTQKARLCQNVHLDAASCQLGESSQTLVKALDCLDNHFLGLALTLVDVQSLLRRLAIDLDAVHIVVFVLADGSLHVVDGRRDRVRDLDAVEHHGVALSVALIAHIAPGQLHVLASIVGEVDVEVSHLQPTAVVDLPVREQRGDVLVQVPDLSPVLTAVGGDHHLHRVYQDALVVGQLVPVKLAAVIDRDVPCYHQYLSQIGKPYIRFKCLQNI